MSKARKEAYAAREREAAAAREHGLTPMGEKPAASGPARKTKTKKQSRGK